MRKTVRIGIHPTYVEPVETDAATIADAIIDFNVKHKEKYDRDFCISGYEIRKNSVKVAMESPIEDGDRIYFVASKGDGMEVEQKLAVFC